MPWNWKTPLGYLIAVAIQYSWITLGVFMVVSCLNIFAGVWILVGAYAIDIKKNLFNLNNIVIKAKYNVSVQKRIEIMKKLCNVIHFHSDIIQLSIDLFCVFFLIKCVKILICLFIIYLFQTNRGIAGCV